MNDHAVPALPSSRAPEAAAPSTTPVVELRRVSKTYAGAGAPALDDVHLDLAAGEVTAIVGRSGSGKSTLLHLLGGLDRPTHGSVRVAGTDLGTLSEAALSAWRGRAVGVVFQFFQLLPGLTALENVLLPMDFVGRWPASARRARALGLLDRFGMAAYAARLPGELSGGEQQRVAVARALANAPAVLLADEPTGNLDSANATALLEVLAALGRDGQSVVLVTHDPTALRHAARCVHLADGRVVADTRAAAVPRP